MKLEVALLAGPETKAVLAELKELLDRLESVSRGVVTITQPATETAALKAAVDEFDSETEDAEVETASDDDFMSEPEPKPTKAKKITVAEVNEACKARAKAGGKNGRAEVLKILKKNFKTESISALKENQYAKALEVLAV